MRRAASGVLVALVLSACGGTSATVASTTVTTTTAAATATTAPTTTQATTTATTAPTTTQATTTTEAPTTTIGTDEIEIVGDPQFVAQADAALDLLADEVPEIYVEVLTRIETIESVPSDSGMDVFTKTFRVGDVTAYAPGYGPADQVVWLAGTIVHDACHSRLFAEGAEYLGRDAELACLEDQLDALLVLSGFAFEDYIQTLIDGVDDPQNEYWTDPNRHW